MVRRTAPDVIVMATHGRGGFKRPGAGLGHGRGPAQRDLSRPHHRAPAAGAGAAHRAARRRRVRRRPVGVVAEDRSRTPSKSLARRARAWSCCTSWRTRCGGHPRRVPQLHALVAAHARPGDRIEKVVVTGDPRAADPAHGGGTAGGADRRRRARGCPTRWSGSTAGAGDPQRALRRVHGAVGARGHDEAPGRAARPIAAPAIALRSPSSVPATSPPHRPTRLGWPSRWRGHMARRSSPCTSSRRSLPASGGFRSLANPALAAPAPSSRRSPAPSTARCSLRAPRASSTKTALREGKPADEILKAAAALRPASS